MLVHHIINILNKVSPVKCNAYVEVKKQLKLQAEFDCIQIPTTPPRLYLKFWKFKVNLVGNGRMAYSYNERWTFSYVLTMLQHFQLNGKITHLLNETLEVTEIKPIQLMTSCSIKCYAFSLPLLKMKVLIPVSYLLTSADIKKVKRTNFCLPKEW